METRVPCPTGRIIGFQSTETFVVPVIEILLIFLDGIPEGKLQLPE